MRLEESVFQFDDQFWLRLVFECTPTGRLLHSSACAETCVGERGEVCWLTNAYMPSPCQLHALMVQIASGRIGVPN